MSAERLSARGRLVEKLAETALFRDYQRAFELATGLPLTLSAVQADCLAHVGRRRQNDFCSRVAQSVRFRVACLAAQQRACRRTNGPSSTVQCPFGIAETAIGVKCGDEVIAYLQTGQVRFKHHPPEDLDDALRRLRKPGDCFDLDELLRLYSETPVVSQREYHARVRLIELFAIQLGTVASHMQWERESHEPPPITRARTFIEYHHHEVLSLPMVARHAGMSSSYFCRKFKAVTGMNFAHYVSCVRLEHAKRMLLAGRHSISEICFVVGFQSLTHFNRTFRKIAGCSPTDYRRKPAPGTFADSADS
jgi:AraC-like DNA-binding protein